MKFNLIFLSSFTALLGMSQMTLAAVSMDRTRVIFDGSNKSISINVTNNNKQLPYLAQSWLEDTEGKKINSPLVVLPPIQRLEPGKSSQFKIQTLPAINSLPQDQETLFYFNMREIPPKSEKENTLQIALQTRVKFFYRPETILPKKNSAPWQEKLVFKKLNNNIIIKNPTPFYVTVIDINEDIKDFDPIMLSPFSEEKLRINTNQLGNNPTLTYINDYGGRVKLNYKCNLTVCEFNKEN